MELANVGAVFVSRLASYQRQNYMRIAEGIRGRFVRLEAKRAQDGTVLCESEAWSDILAGKEDGR